MPGARGGKKRVLDVLESELQVAVNQGGVFGMKPWSSARVINALKHCAISPVPGVLGFAPECGQVTQLASGQLRYGRGDKIKEVVWVVL